MEILATYIIPFLPSEDPGDAVKAAMSLGRVFVVLRL